MRRFGSSSPCTTIWRQATRAPPPAARLQQAVDAILDGYANGTRFGIRACADDGLLRAGVPGVQLTWMDAKVGDWVVTPRIGKPVEVQALWINALRIAAAWNPRWQQPVERALRAFRERFVDPSTQALVRCRRRRSRRRRDRPRDPAEPDFRGRRPAVPVARRRGGARGGRSGRSAAADAARPAHARAVRSRLPRALRRLAAANAMAPIIRERSGRGCSARSSKRGCACTATRAEPARKPKRAFSTPLLRASRSRRASTTSPKSPTAMRRTRPRGTPFQAWSLGRVAAHREPACPVGRPSPRQTALRCVSHRQARQQGRRHATAARCQSARHHRRCPPALRRLRPLATLGPVSQRASMGHGARGLQRGRHRLGLFPARSRAQPRLSLGRRRHRRFRRRQAAAGACRSRCGTATTRSSRSGCSASPTRRAITART